MHPVCSSCEHSYGHLREACSRARGMGFSCSLAGDPDVIANVETERLRRETRPAHAPGCQSRNRSPSSPLEPQMVLFRQLATTATHVHDKREWILTCISDAVLFVLSVCAWKGQKANPTFREVLRGCRQGCGRGPAGRTRDGLREEVGGRCWRGSPPVAGFLLFWWNGAPCPEPRAVCGRRRPHPVGGGA